MNVRVGPKRVLVIAYLFPPVGGAGVQRAAKFVKYLPQNGWATSVLTVSNPSVPVFDESLNDDIPEDSVIRYAKTLEPGYGLKSMVSAGDQAKSSIARSILKNTIRSLSNLILQPDSQILWWPDAVSQGMRLLDEIRHHAILVTAPPFSSFLVGATLSRHTGLPLVLDYRDEWDISNAYWENKQKDPISRWIQSRIQRNLVERAHGLIATTQSSAESLQRIADRVGSRARVRHIYNGYDAADFADADCTLDLLGKHVLDELTELERLETGSDLVSNAENNPTEDTYPVDTRPESVSDAPDNCYRLAYVGTLWNLTSVQPLAEGLEQLASHDPQLASRIQVIIAGRRTGPDERLGDRLCKIPCQVERQPYLEHASATNLMRHSDALCLLLSDVPQANRVVPAKVFEYMAARKPILAIVPDGEVADILADCPYACICQPGNAVQIAQTLSELIRQRNDRAYSHDTAWSASQYERRILAGELAGMLDAVCAPIPAQPAVALARADAGGSR